MPDERLRVVENEEPFVLRCGRLAREHEALVKQMGETINGFKEPCEEEKTVRELKGL